MTTPAIVQTVGGGYGVSPQSTTITSSTAGNLLVIAITTYVNAVGTVTGVTDNKSQTWVQATGARGTNSANNTATDIWYFPNTASGVTSVTVTFTGGALAEQTVYEVSGIKTSSPLDVAGGVSSGASTTTAVSASLTTTAANDFILVILDQNPNVSTVNSPYTKDSQTGHTAYYIPTTTVSGSQCTFNLSSADTFCTSSAAFLAVTGGGGGGSTIAAFNVSNLFDIIR